MKNEQEQAQAVQLLFQIFQLRRIHRVLQTPTKELTRSEHGVLRVFAELKRKADGDVKVKTTEISRILHMAPQTLTPVIQSLVEKGFVAREYGKKDRRTIYLVLTDAGNQLTIDLQDEITEKMIELTDGFTMKEKEELIHLLKKMNEIIAENIKQEE